jgi:HK97 family phage major capsid protein
MAGYLDELRGKRFKLAQDADAILQKTKEEGRNLSQEEKNKFDAIMEDADKLQSTIDAEERAAKLRDNLGQPQENHLKNDPSVNMRDKQEISKEVRQAFNKYLIDGKGALSSEEMRALMQSGDIKGGYLTPPQQFVSQLIKNVDDLVFIRQLATVYPVQNSEGIGVPTMESDLNDADWTQEIKTVNEDDAITFGKRELKPHPLAKLVKISRKLLQTAAIDPESIVRDRLAYKFGVTQEKAFLTGDGKGKPLGVFVNSNDGIPASRDVLSGVTADINGDSLIEVKMALKAAYWQNAAWVFSREILKRIRKLKATTGDYVWQPGLSQDMPDRILEISYKISEYCPNTFTTGSYVGILGDFKRGYWIAESMAMEIQILIEKYAENNQNGYIARYESDGMPVLSEAFARIKLS